MGLLSFCCCTTTYVLLTGWDRQKNDNNSLSTVTSQVLYSLTPTPEPLHGPFFFFHNNLHTNVLLLLTNKQIYVLIDARHLSTYLYNFKKKERCVAPQTLKSFLERKMMVRLWGSSDRLAKTLLCGKGTVCYREESLWISFRSLF